MSKKFFSENVNWQELRSKAGLTLQQLAEISGYSVAAINGLELKGEGSPRLKDKLHSILLSSNEEGARAEVGHWRERALIAEEKLRILKKGLEGVLKKF